MVFGKRGNVNYRLLIALVLMKEWGIDIKPYKLIKLNKNYNFDFLKCSTKTIYKYTKEIEHSFNDVKSLLKTTKFLEEYREK